MTEEPYETGPLAPFADATHDLTCEHDLEGNILTANSAAAHALELTLEQLCTLNLRDVISVEAQSHLVSYLETIRRDGVSMGMLTVRTASGRKRVWEYRNVIACAPGGRTVVRGLAHEVTDREEALQKLRASERQLRTIVDNASDIIGIVDPSGLLQFHSPSAERTLGYGFEELNGRSFYELVHEDDFVRAKEFFEKQFSLPDQPRRTIDLRVRHRDGSWRLVSMVASPVVWSGSNASIILNARDITERKLLIAQLEQANRLNSLGKLAATVAHEFNNVLMGIQPFADLMKRPDITPDLVAKGARHIANSVARGKRVALDILRFTNPANPMFEPVDVADWWKKLAPEMRASAGDNIELTASFSGPLTILADGSQLSQVFANLISNARHAMPRGGRLRILARQARPGESFPFGVVPNPERFVYFIIEDTGCGMPENVLRHAFEPLFTTKTNGGTGIGLAVTHQLVCAHGGYVFAESKPGIGSAFHLFFPVAEGTVNLAEAPSHRKPARDMASTVEMVNTEC